MLLDKYISIGGTHGEIPKDLWPKSFIDLNPMTIRTFHDGILLRTYIDKRYESGIYFDLGHPEIEAGSGSGEVHSKIAYGIYATEIKIRPPMKLKKPMVKNQ